jgi:hypothetical protein
MGKLIIDGNSFFEIDEECLKKKRVLKKCGLDKYFREEDKYMTKNKTERKNKQNYKNERN